MAQGTISKEDLNKVFDNEFYKMAKKLQANSGLWPFQSNFEKNFKRMLIFLLLLVSLHPFVSNY